MCFIGHRKLQYLLWTACVMCVSAHNNVIDVDDILSNDYMPGSLLVLENPEFGNDLLNSSTTKRDDVELKMRSFLNGSFDEAVVTMGFHRKMMNEYLCRNFLAEQIVTDMSTSKIRRRLGIPLSSTVQPRPARVSFQVKDNMMNDEGSRTYKDWLSKSTTLEDIYRHYETDVQKRNDDRAVDDDKDDDEDKDEFDGHMTGYAYQAPASTPPKVVQNYPVGYGMGGNDGGVYRHGGLNFGHGIDVGNTGYAGVHSGYGGGYEGVQNGYANTYGTGQTGYGTAHGFGGITLHSYETGFGHSNEDSHKYHESNNKEKDLSDLFDIALTALAYLSFGMFVIHVVMCISSVQNNATTLVTMMPMSMSMSPAASEPTGGGMTGDGMMGGDMTGGDMTGTGTGGDMTGTGDMTGNGGNGMNGNGGDMGMTGSAGITGMAGNGDNMDMDGNGGDMGMTGNGDNMGMNGNGGDMGITSDGADTGMNGNGGNTGSTGNAGDMGMPDNGGDMGITGDGDGMGATATGGGGDMGMTGNDGGTDMTANGGMNGGGDDMGMTSNGGDAGMTGNGMTDGDTGMNGADSGMTGNGIDGGDMGGDGNDATGGGNGGMTGNGNDMAGDNGGDGSMTGTGDGAADGNGGTGGDMTAGGGTTGDGSTGAATDGGDDGGRIGIQDSLNFRYRRDIPTITNPNNQALNELARRILTSIEASLIASDDNGMCLRKTLCENNKYSRTLSNKNKIWIPVWSLGMSWLSGRLSRNDSPSTSMLDSLKASVLGLGKANCDVIYQECDLAEERRKRRRRRRKRSSKSRA